LAKLLTPDIVADCATGVAWRGCWGAGAVGVPSKPRKSKSDPKTDETAAFWAAGVGATGVEVAGEELIKRSLPADTLKAPKGSLEGTISTWPKPVSTTVAINSNKDRQTDINTKTKTKKVLLKVRFSIGESWLECCLREREASAPQRGKIRRESGRPEREKPRKRKKERGPGGAVLLKGH